MHDHRPVTLSAQPITLSAHPVTLSAHPVTLCTQPVKRFALLVTRFALPVTLLAFLGVPGAAPLAAQSLPKVWNRSTDWVDQKNPGPDGKGNLVWYHGHYFGSKGAYSQWNTAWHGWTFKHSSAYYNDADPVTKVALVDFTLYTLWRRYFFVNPMMELRNTTKEPFLAAVEGKFDLRWTGWTSPKAPLTDAEIFVEHYDWSTGKWTALAHFTESKPTNNTDPEAKVLPIKTATVRMDVNDRIRIRLAAKNASSTDSMLVLYDRDVNIVRKSITAAKEVERFASPKNPLTLSKGRTSGPILGKTWDPFLTNSPTTGRSDLLALGVTKIHATTPFGTLLTDPLVLVTAKPRASFPLAIPLNTALAGVELSAQGAAVTASGGLQLANALDVRVGDF